MPIYPEVNIDGRTYYRTIDSDVFIESMGSDGIVYVNFKDRVRWRQSGDCRNCGLGDIGSLRERELIVAPGKQMGETWSTTDPEYKTRLDIPVAPDYDRCSRRMAKEMGIEPYPCGMTFDRLPFDH